LERKSGIIDSFKTVLRHMLSELDFAGIARLRIIELQGSIHPFQSYDHEDGPVQQLLVPELFDSIPLGVNGVFAVPTAFAAAPRLIGCIGEHFA
jgi:hypothetical protein